MSKKMNREVIGKTSTGLPIVKIVTGGRGRPAIDVEVAKGKYVNHRAWAKENGEPLRVSVPAVTDVPVVETTA